MTLLKRIVDSDWPATCAKFWVAPVNRAFYHLEDDTIYAKVSAPQSVFLHECGHAMKLPRHVHPQLPANPKRADYLRAIIPYLQHAWSVGFDVRAGTGLLRLRGPRHGQDKFLKSLVAAP